MTAPNTPSLLDAARSAVAPMLEAIAITKNDLDALRLNDALAALRLAIAAEQERKTRCDEAHGDSCYGRRICETCLTAVERVRGTKA